MLLLAWGWPTFGVEKVAVDEKMKQLEGLMVNKQEKCGCKHVTKIQNTFTIGQPKGNEKILFTTFDQEGEWKERDISESSAILEGYYKEMFTTCHPS